MRVVCNITSIPSRFKHLQSVIDNLNQHDTFDEIVVHIPKKYARFDTEVDTDALSSSLKNARVNVVDTDYGAGTRIVYGEGDIVFYCDDDTFYVPVLSKRILERLLQKNCVVSGSGFNFQKYFQKDFSKTIQGETVQVVEGYGMVALRREWVDTIRDEFIDHSKLVNNDDFVLSNLLDKYGIEKQIILSDGLLKQYSYGFDKDALHYNDGEKTHFDSYKRMLREFRNRGICHFKPVVSYAICVCNESQELDNLLYCLDETILCDEIQVLVDTKKVTDNVREVLKKYNVRNVHERAFCGNFSAHKNYLNEQCNGSYVFSIDADEIPSSFLVENVYKIISETKCDLAMIPRVNILAGATRQFLQDCNFSLSDQGFINWPDMQGRLYKNTPSSIKWGNKLHERIQGANVVIQLQSEPNLALWHVKSVQRMKRQDAFYRSMSK